MDNNNTKLVLKSMVRLKALRLNSDLQKDYDDYSHKFNKIMDVLDDNGLGISKLLEDILFDAGLSNGSKWFRNIQFRNDYDKIQKRKIPEKVEFLDYHKAHGHVNMELLEMIAKKQNIEIVDVVECKTCVKHAVMLESINCPKPKTTSQKILETFHFHLSAEFPVIGFTGVTRFLLIIDDYSKMMFIYTIQNKNEVMKILFKFLTYSSRFRENSIRKIVTDDIEEFDSPHIDLFLRNRKIRQIKIGSNEKDEFVDYYARSIQIMLKLLMYDASCVDHIDPALWSEAIKAAVYVYNNLPSEDLDWNSPSDIWLDKSLVLAKKFYSFGKWFMASFPNQTIKLKRCRFVGYHPHEENFYRFYCPRDETIGFGCPAYELFEKKQVDRSSKSKENVVNGSYNSDRYSSENHRHSSSDKYSDRRNPNRDYYSNRDYSNRDHSNRDHSNRDYSNRDYSNRDHSNRDYSNRDRSNRDHLNRDYPNGDLSNRDNSDKDHSVEKEIRIKQDNSDISN